MKLAIIILALSGALFGQNGNTQLLATQKSAGGGGSAITLVTHAGAGNSGSSTDATASATTTGANFIYVSCVYFQGGTAPTISDSLANTWTARTPNCGTWVCEKGFYVVSPATGSGHSFDCNGAGNNPAIFMAAFSGVALSSTVESQTTNSDNGDAGHKLVSLLAAPSAVTPAAANELIIAPLAFGYQGENGGVVLLASYTSVDSSFTTTDSVDNPGFAQMGGALAYQIQTTATARQPTFTLTIAAGVPTGWEETMAASLVVIK